MNQELDLELLTDACLSTSNHSLGEPETHQYIPGRTLWGALATLAYRSWAFTEDEAFRIFHQGAVQISDALPLQSQHRSYPVPLAWHEPKNTPGQSLQNFALESVRKHCAGDQYQGKKGGWVSADRREIKVETDFSLRTSVDPSGKARQGLLFGLPVLRAGTRFHATLSGTKVDLDKVLALVKSQELRVGRSKNSELGLVRVKPRSQPAIRLEHGAGSATTVSVFCVSRCVFRDPHTGAPTLLPKAAALGLPKDWEFDSASSFVRTVGVVHFNAKRGRPETERFAIERGSVLTFRGNSTDLAPVINFVTSGVGEHCGQGYGEVLVAPSWLTQDKPFSLEPPEVSTESGAKEPTDALFSWAQQRAGQKNRAIGLYSQAQEAADQLKRHRVPGSQWGVVRRMAREARFQSQLATRLWEDLFSEEKGFLFSGKRKLSESWKRAMVPLKQACEGNRSEQDLPMFLEFLASACMRPARESKGDLS